MIFEFMSISNTFQPFQIGLKNAKKKYGEVKFSYIKCYDELQFEIIFLPLKNFLYNFSLCVYIVTADVPVVLAVAFAIKQNSFLAFHIVVEQFAYFF